jgi:crossover junction endodeoxyribonuclease RuvC
MTTVLAAAVGWARGDLRFGTRWVIAPYHLMLVLGIDPGTRYLGWGLVRRESTRLEHVAHGVVVLDASASLAERLVGIEQALGEILRVHKPDAAAVESLFFHKDAQAASKLGHARGVVLLVLTRAAVSLGEYSPALVKRTVVGRGAADKRQVALVMKAMLGLGQLPRADATDALALAITHLRVAHLPAAAVKHPSSSKSLPPHLLARVRRK